MERGERGVRRIQWVWRHVRIIRPVWRWRWFDTVHHEARLDFLRLRALHAEIVLLPIVLYSWIESVIKCVGGVSCLFPLTTGVIQRCVLALSLFSTYKNWVLSGPTCTGSCDLQWRHCLWHSLNKDNRCTPILKLVRAHAGRTRAEPVEWRHKARLPCLSC